MPRFVTLADLAREGKLVECGCSICGLVSYVKPGDMGLKMNIEVPLIARWHKCSGCGACNTATASPVWVRPDPRVVLGG
jgi:hypothetical protein